MSDPLDKTLLSDAGLLRRPAVFSGFPDLVSAESTRHGGVSEAPFASLNLGKSTADDPARVAENRRRFCAALGFTPEQMAWSVQVHGNAVRVVEAPGGGEGFDSLVTDRPGILLAVSIADCTPILIFDFKNRAVAAVHSGWPGTAARVVEKTLETMKNRYGTAGEDCYAYVGTCIDECSFEVGVEVAERFEPEFRRYDPERGKFLVDLKKANAAMLRAFGVREDRIAISPYSTVLNNDDYFSHRKEKGATGRMVAAIGMKQ
ncbi:MAG: peptidoglycan editing factor PgeF [Lewinellaceae bacterium]|nr:peptidoglycan editing factor PgeF [Lewinellaceae bacterium]